MSNEIKRIINSIEVPSDLGRRSVAGVMKAKEEMKVQQSNPLLQKISIAVLVAAMLGLFFVGKDLIKSFTSKGNFPIVSEEDALNNSVFEDSAPESGAIEIPPIEMPKTDSNADSDMSALIIYKGRVYEETASYIQTGLAKDLLGEKLATAQGGIDEASGEDDYQEELASTLGEVDFYAVKGYDENFRIMTYNELDGEVYAQFFENLNGISVASGEDVFGKLKLSGKVKKAAYRRLDDWYYSRENFIPIDNEEVLNNFIDALYSGTPKRTDDGNYPSFNNLTNKNFRELTLHLKDGVVVTLDVIEDGYVRYGNMPVYFEIEKEVFQEAWKLFQGK